LIILSLKKRIKKPAALIGPPDSISINADQNLLTGP